MIFSADRDKFIRMVQKSAGIVDKKTSVTVLSQVKLEADGDKVKMTCTDYDVVLIDRCDARVVRPGRVVLPGKNLLDVLKALSGKEFTAELTQGTLCLSAPGRSYKLSCMESDDYPNIEKPSSVPSVKVPIDVMLEVFDKTAFCMANTPERLNLNGVHLVMKPCDDGIELVCQSTDGHRLSSYRVTVPGSMDKPLWDEGVIVHRKGVLEAKKILASCEGDVEIGAVCYGEIVFKAGSSELYVRLIAEQYPDTSTLVHDNKEFEITVGTKALSEALKAVCIMSDPALLTITLEVSGDQLAISASDSRRGSGRAEVPVSFTGTPFAVGLNHRYFSDALDVTNSEKVVMKFSGAADPILYSPVSDTEKFSYILMPVDD
jgi:DNA polymerase-3 subunit beta